MRIAIATGIYPPEVGGPSLYAKSLAESLEREGHTVRVVLFGALKKLPSGIRHGLYALKLLWHALRADGMIVLDTFSVAIPAAIVARITGIRTLNRAGGDFVWEQYIERTKERIPLPDFYRHRDKLNRKERVSFALIQWALSRAHIVFSTPWLRDIWQSAYAFDQQKTHVIENAIEPRLPYTPYSKRNFLLYSRAIALKNTIPFSAAFRNAREEAPDIELEEGSISHDALMKKMQSCYAVVIPSVSEVSPNLVLESIRCGKPFLLTQYSGYAPTYGEFGILIDPLDAADMERGVQELLKPEVYEERLRRIAAFKKIRTYDDIAKEYEQLLETI